MKLFYRRFGLVCLIAAAAGLSACGGGGGGDDTPPTPPAEDPSGLYKNGTADLNGGALALSDLRGFVYNNRVIIFSVDGRIMFDGSVDSVSEDQLTATVDVYVDGEISQTDVAVTATVNEQSQIVGTISGTGVADGTFTLLYDSAYEVGATQERITDIDEDYDYRGDLVASFSLAGESVLDGFQTSFGTFDVFPWVANGDGSVACFFEGVFSIPNSNVNIYSFEVDLSSSISLNVSKCTEMTLDPADLYTGFGSVLSESGTDNDALFAVSNGEFAVFGILEKDAY